VLPETYIFRFRGDQTILNEVHIVAESISEAFAQAREIASQTPGTTQILHGQGVYSI
jgi:hypothetical protein